MNRDYGIRFSDESYLSKDDIKKTMNLTSVDFIWESVLKYRGLYSKVCDLFSIDKKPYSYCLTSGITNKIIKLEKKLNKLEIKSIKYDFATVSSYFKCEILSILSIMNSISDISSNVIDGLVNKTIENIPQKYMILNNYLTCLNDIETRNANSLNEHVVKRLYSILLYGTSDKFLDIKSTYRSFDIHDYDENNEYNESAPCEKINELMSCFFEFIDSIDTFSIATSAFVFYYINYIKPFEFFNEEMALLLAKYILNNEGDNVTHFPLEKVLLLLQNNELKKVFIDSQNGLDLTYFLIKFIDLLNDSIGEIEKFYQKEEDKIIQQEVLKEDKLFETNVDKEEKQIREYVNKEDKYLSGVNFERKVSLPTIPSGLSENDASLVADHLLELCPTLKRGQAEFYARHCTIGKYYNIQQYKDFNDVAYETARTSMDNLTLLGFYKKEKIRNKFVYTPVLREND